MLDIVLQAAAGATPLTPAFNRSPNNTLGDGVDRNDVPYLPVFPYLGYPHAGKQIGVHRVRRCSIAMQPSHVAAAFVAVATIRDASAW